LPRAVWFAANPPLRIDTLPPEDDGIQLTIPRLLTSNLTDDFLCKTIFTLWYIWKARNDNRFQRKNWSPLQVHHAVLADLNTYMLALREVLQTGCTDQQALAVPPSSPTMGHNINNKAHQTVQLCRQLRPTITAN
jgi:hypothetical protein